MSGNSKTRLIRVDVETARIEAERRLMERSFHEFAKRAWHVVEPQTPFQDGWHIRIICKHLQALAEGWICQRGPEKGKPLRRLVINMPPRHMKSMLGSVLFVAWVWTRFPGKQFLNSSYSGGLSNDHAALALKLVTSKWYQFRWGKTGNPVIDRDGYVHLNRQRVERFTNDQAGVRQASSVLGKTTGTGGDIITTDDPHNLLERESDIKMARVIVWWTKAMSTRGNDPRTVCHLVIMQRIAANDLSEYCIRNGYSLLKLPARYEGEKEIGVFDDFDPREVEGDPLWADRFSDIELADLEYALGDDAPGQLQQRPTAAGGNIVDIRNCKIYGARVLDALLAKPQNVDAWCITWDFAVKGAKKGKKRSWTCGTVWARRGPDAFIIDRVRIQGDLTAQIEACVALADRWPQARPILVEDKANGPAVVDALQGRVAGLELVNPRGDKVQRLFAVSIFFRSANVWIPDHTMAPWVGNPTYEHGQLLAEPGTWAYEIANFPNIPENDQVDCTSMALDFLMLQQWDPGPMAETGDPYADLDAAGISNVRARAKLERAFHREMRVRRLMNPNAGMPPERQMTGVGYRPPWEED